MGISRSIIRVPAIVALLVAGACVGLSALGLIEWGAPKVKSTLEMVVEQYDKYFPQVTIQGGHASVEVPQPYFVDFGQKGEAPIVLDTRPGHESEALDYLKDAKSGFVLTHDSFFIKNQGQIRVVPLKTIPDMVLNSRSLQRYVKTYVPRLMSLAVVAIVIYYMLAKAFQIFVLALIPYFWTRSCPLPVTYGQALKLTAFAMLIPVLVNSVQDLGGVHVPTRFLLYFGLFLVTLILASLDLVRSAKSAPQPWTGINP